eukprot:scaffold8152_cov195-Amphora_coffeaeformis.AAC.3
MTVIVSPPQNNTVVVGVAGGGGVLSPKTTLTTTKTTAIPTTTTTTTTLSTTIKEEDHRPTGDVLILPAAVTVVSRTIINHKNDNETKEGERGKIIVSPDMAVVVVDHCEEREKQDTNSSLSSSWTIVSQFLLQRAKSAMNQDQTWHALANAAAILTLSTFTFHEIDENYNSADDAVRQEAYQLYQAAWDESTAKYNGCTTADLMQHLLPILLLSEYDEQTTTTEPTTACQQILDTYHAQMLQAWKDEAKQALQSNMPHDALALAAASLRLQWHADMLCILCQCLVRLGEPALAVQAVELTQRQNPQRWNDHRTNIRPLREVHLYASYLRQLLSSNDDHHHHHLNNSNTSPTSSSSSLWINHVPFIKIPAAFWPNWYAGSNVMELYDTVGKGRGVRATTNLPAGQVLLIERALIRKDENSNDATKESTSTSLFESSQQQFQQHVVQRSLRDAIFTTICHQLYHGVDASAADTVTPLSATNTTFDELLLNLDHHHQGQVLLPSHAAYLFQDTVETAAPLDDRQAAGMIQHNAHGFRQGQSNDRTNQDKHVVLELFPALDMWNHNVVPNCKYCKLSKPGAADLAVCMTTRPVAAGEELTISYGPNQDLIRENFGF